MHVHFICSGAIGVYEKRVAEEVEEQGAPSRGEGSIRNNPNEVVLLNLYTSGQSLGDPEINFRTPLSTRVIVKERDTKVVSLSRESFYYVYGNKLNAIVVERK